MKTDVLIIGAGLSGLQIANLLKAENIQASIVESRSRPGGRMHSDHQLDLGPSWFWPWQTRMGTLVKSLHLEGNIFDQYSNGLGVAEYRNGQLVQQNGVASMAGSRRLAGGLNILSEALVARIGSQHIHYESRVVKISRETDGVRATLNSADGNSSIFAKKVVLAAPPRVLADSIVFDPPLSDSIQQQMKQTPTWMAGQAKFAAVYDSPFWQDNGLSGDGVSEIGPLGEIHDASAISGAPFALFGFVGIPAHARLHNDAGIIEAATIQLARMFGTGNEQPKRVFYKDWAQDNYTSTDADATGPRAHVHESVDTRPLWDNKLFWAGSETASVSSGDNGYLEGALAAAERAVSQLA